MSLRFVKKIYRTIDETIYWIKVQKYKMTNNQFMIDLFTACKKYGKRYDVFISMERKYGEKLKAINKDLYLKLNFSDRDTFIRFILKAFYGENTATKDELEVIDHAFDEVKKLYKNKQGKDYVEFVFRGKKIRYLVNRETDFEDLKPEKILMNYYDLAHAFYLTEYELEGFNPKDGEEILDCGAAYGDTMLMFRTLYPSSRIHSFESMRDNVEIINKNKELNKVDNVVINEAFLYSDSKHHVLDLNNYKINDDFRSEKAQEIHTLSIDDYVKEHDIRNIGLIKFDIEGGEEAALRGAIETIKSQRPLLYIPIYHLESDIYIMPEFLKQLDLPMEFRLKWTEKKVWGVDCVLFVKFLNK